jgi:hypothetical protein
MSKYDNPYFSMPDFDDLLSRLEGIRPKVDVELQALATTLNGQQSDWDAWTSKDSRMAALAHIGMLIDSTNLALTFMNEDLLPLENDWWNETHKPPFAGFNESHRAATVNTFNNAFIKQAFLQFHFSIIDTSFRIFLRHIDPTVCRGSTVAFRSVYTTLKARTTAFPTDSDALIDTLRITRNTIHNNGVYFNKDGLNEQITFKGKTYDFLNGQPIEFVNWAWLFEMLEETLVLMVKVINDPQIISATTEIADPFTSNRTLASS